MNGAGVRIRSSGPPLIDRRVTAFVTAAVVVVLSLMASPAEGHAYVLEVSPADGAGLDEAPSEVTVTFNEAVEVPSDGLRVFDESAQRVDEGVVEGTANDVVAARLPALPDGSYVLTYRVVSEDGHTAGGLTTFTVGAAGRVDDALLSQIAAGSEAPVATVAGRVLRGLGYAAGLVAVGAVMFAMFVAQHAGDRRTARRIGVGSAVTASGLGVAAIFVQAAVVAGSPSAALDPTTLAEVVTSSFGTASVIRVVALLSLAAIWAAALPAAALVAGVAVIGSYLMDGHQRTVEPTWLLMAADGVHLSAAAVWAAGVVILVATVRRRGSEGPGRAADLVSRFSRVALFATLGVVAAGVLMAIPLVGTPSALISTPYGRLLLIKVAVALVVIGIAAGNRWVLLPRLMTTSSTHAPATGDGSTAGDADPHDIRDDGSGGWAASEGWRRLPVALRAEAALLLVVVLVTGFLAGTQPASDAAGLGGLYEATEVLGGDLEVDLVVDPNRVGRNTMHVYVLDPTGRPASDVEDLTMELTFREQQIGPITIEPLFAGPGHWIATVEDFAIAGDWEVRLVVGVDRFTEETATFTVPVAP